LFVIIRAGDHVCFKFAQQQHWNAQCRQNANDDDHDQQLYQSESPYSVPVFSHIDF